MLRRANAGASFPTITERIWSGFRVSPNASIHVSRTNATAMGTAISHRRRRHPPDVPRVDGCRPNTGLTSGPR